MAGIANMTAACSATKPAVSSAALMAAHLNPVEKPVLHLAVCSLLDCTFSSASYRAEMQIRVCWELYQAGWTHPKHGAQIVLSLAAEASWAALQKQVFQHKPKACSCTTNAICYGIFNPGHQWGVPE